MWLGHKIRLLHTILVVVKESGAILKTMSSRDGTGEPKGKGKNNSSSPLLSGLLEGEDVDLDFDLSEAMGTDDPDGDNASGSIASRTLNQEDSESLMQYLPRNTTEEPALDESRQSPAVRAQNLDGDFGSSLQNFAGSREEQALAWIKRVDPLLSDAIVKYKENKTSLLPFPDRDLLHQLKENFDFDLKEWLDKTRPRTFKAEADNGTQEPDSKKPKRKSTRQGSHYNCGVCWNPTKGHICNPTIDYAVKEVIDRLRGKRKKKRLHGVPNVRGPYACGKCKLKKKTVCKCFDRYDKLAEEVRKKADVDNVKDEVLQEMIFLAIDESRYLEIKDDFLVSIDPDRDISVAMNDLVNEGLNGVSLDSKLYKSFLPKGDGLWTGSIMCTILPFLDVCCHPCR